MKAIANEGYFFSRKSNEIASLVEGRPPIPPGLLIEAFDTLLRIRVPPPKALTKGPTIQFEVDISESEIVVGNLDLNVVAMARHGPTLWEDDATRFKIISKCRIGFRKPHRYIRIH